MAKVSDDKKILDVTCGSRTIWFNKAHPAALYTDQRRESHELHTIGGVRQCDVDPDIIADFTDLPFPDNTFHLVVFDPPHLKSLGVNAWYAKKYGRLLPGWETDIKGGFDQCMRVLKPNGVLIFKWNELEVSRSDLLNIIEHEPLFGHTMYSNEKTHWMTFMKL